jgi:hypothetical protein
VATWTRNGSGTFPNATDLDVTGTLELDNGTVPGDWDGAAVNSVRIQFTLAILSGSFQSGGAEKHDVYGAADLTLNGNGTTIASVDGADGILDDGTNGGSTVATDETDSSIGTGHTDGEWENSELNPTGGSAQWTDYIKNKGADGVNVGIHAIGAIVTIDYTPASSDKSGTGSESSESSGAATGVATLEISGSGSESSQSSGAATGTKTTLGTGSESSQSSGTSTGQGDRSGSGSESSQSSGTVTGLPGKSGTGPLETSNSSGTATGVATLEISGSGSESSQSSGAASGFKVIEISGSGSESSQSSGSTTGFNARFGTGSESSESSGTTSTAGSPLDNTTQVELAPPAMTATAAGPLVLVQLSPSTHYAEARS